MKFFSIICRIICVCVIIILWFPAWFFSLCEKLLTQECNMDSLKIGHLKDYLTKETLTKVKDPQKEKERREEHDKFVKDLNRLKEIGINKTINTNAVAQFYLDHEKKFIDNMCFKEFCKVICVQVGYDYDDRTYRSTNTEKNNIIKGEK